MESQSPALCKYRVLILQELRDAIVKLPQKHEKEQAALLEGYRAFYHKWYFQLRSNIGLVFGSYRLTVHASHDWSYCCIPV